jgi:HAD superfamily hydrolase (TIGR01490 family)|tara:strand:- start:2941 stop:3660 length:720 start_codon:yes stop_codon:yes gene_type:complete
MDVNRNEFTLLLLLLNFRTSHLTLAIFDLDETLISADSDHAWGEFIIRKGLVEESTHRELNNQFYNDYRAGCLDIDAYMKFSCSVLAATDSKQLISLREDFVEQEIKPLVQPGALELVESHRSAGDTLMIITATIEFITRPIADLFGIDTLIAPIPEVRDGEYTGKLSGVPSFREGKVIRLNAWLKDNPDTLAGSYFYSDSINDLPLLELVDHPTAVNPDESLQTVAKNRGWPILNFRT